MLEGIDAKNNRTTTDIVLNPDYSRRSDRFKKPKVLLSLGT